MAQPKIAVGMKLSSKKNASGNMQTAADAVLQIMIRLVEKRLRSRPIDRMYPA